MYQKNKRSSESNEISSVETKRICTNFDQDKIVRIEDLSNELFYELFEYLDGIDIYKAFSKLNSRFQNLIMHSSFPLKIKFNSSSESEIQHYCSDIIVPNKHRILALYFEDESLIGEFFTYCVLDSSFDRLQSIILNDISLSDLVTLFFYLKALPQLFSLTIDINGEYACNLSSIYRMIFSLPALKYNKLSLSSYIDENFNISIPFAINEKFSNIVYLIINHNCNLNELFSMLYRTPKLRHLYCENLIESNTIIHNKPSLALSNLLYLYIGDSNIEFDEFEMFIAKIAAPLQVLNIKQYMGVDYFDGDQWEQLVKKYIPNLRTFDYEYHQWLPALDHEEISIYSNIESFNSLFWIEKQHFSEVQIIDDDLICSVHPYRKICSDIYKYSDIARQFNQNLSFDSNPYSFIPTIQLSISSIPSDEQNQLFLDKFKTMFGTVQFTRLNIDRKDIPIPLLTKIIYLMPNLDSLKVSSLPMMQQDWLFDNDSETYYSTSINNKITKVNLENITDIEQVHFMIYICIHVQYLQINVSPTMDLEKLLRLILIKANTYIPQLRLLCLTRENIGEETLDHLQTMIDTEDLLVNYTIKRLADHIVLEWARS